MLRRIDYLLNNKYGSHVIKPWLIFVTYVFSNIKKKREEKRKENRREEKKSEEKLVANTKHFLILWFIFMCENVITISFKWHFMNILKYYIFNNLLLIIHIN